jgi:hypothetical protein
VAPLRETREVRDKFSQYKLLALFTRVSKGLHNTVMESNGTANAVDNSAIWTWVLENRDTDSRFYLAENNKTSTRAVTNFSMTVKTSAGAVTIPSMQLAGRQSRWVVTDYAVGNETLLYSSAEIATYGLFDSPVLVFYLKVHLHSKQRSNSCEILERGLGLPSRYPFSMDVLRATDY